MVCSVALFDVIFGTVYLIFVPVKVGERSLFGGNAPSVNRMFSVLCLLVVLVISHYPSGQVRRPRLLLFHATVPCNQYNLFPCGRMGLDSLGRPLI